MDMMIEVEDLTAFETAPDGATTCLMLRDAVGNDVGLVLPLACLNSLMATLPQMLAEARQRQNGDPNLRIVYPVEEHIVESAGDAPFRILTLVTRGKGQVSYRLSVDQCRDIADAGTADPVNGARRRLN